MTWEWQKAFERKDYAAKGDPAKDQAKHRRGAGDAARRRARENPPEDRSTDGVAWRPARVNSAGLARGFSTELLEGEVYACAFCRGKGESRMGGQCPICRGDGTVRVAPPAVQCAFCRGGGQVPPRSSLTCCVCKGKGVVAVKGPVETCGDCRGRGRKTGVALYCGRCGGTGVVALPRPAEPRAEGGEAAKVA